MDLGPLRFTDLSAGATVVGLFRVMASTAAVARTGSRYHRLTLGDRAGGRLPARRFDVGAAPPPAVDDVVRVTGVLEDYRGTPCLKVRACEVATDVAVAAFFPRVPLARRATLPDLDALIAGIAEPALRAWVVACVATWSRERLAAAPAAVVHHGAAVGGLLSHTVRVTQIAQALAEPAGPSVDRDVLRAAALLHDLGKLEELPPEPGREPTDRGRLLGHVVLGALAIAGAAARVPGLAPGRVEAVLHAVLAAHGRLEFGAPVVPATLEALLLHQADRAEATLAVALEAVERVAPDTGWTAYLPHLGARLRCAPAVAGEATAG